MDGRSVWLRELYQPNERSPGLIRHETDAIAHGGSLGARDRSSLHARRDEHGPDHARVRPRPRGAQSRPDWRTGHAGCSTGTARSPRAPRSRRPRLPQRPRKGNASSNCGCAGRLDLSGCAGKPPVTAKHGEFANEVLKVGGTKREYRLFVPTSVDLARPAPLVVAFHAMLIDSKDVMPTYTRLNQTAQRHGFVIAYPNAIGDIWGLLPDRVAADIDFFDALLKHLSVAYRIDSDRCTPRQVERRLLRPAPAPGALDHIAAAASHSGLLGLQALGGVNAARKFPVLIVHGTLDLNLPVRPGPRERKQIPPGRTRGEVHRGPWAHARLGHGRERQRADVGALCRASTCARGT